MVDPEEATVARHGAAHGHARIGGEWLCEKALCPGAHRRGQLRFLRLPRLGGFLQFAPIHEQVNTRQERILGQNLLGGGTVRNAGAHAEALILAVELLKSLTQQGEVGVRGALQNLRRVVAGVFRVNRGGKIDAARVGGQRQPGGFGLPVRYGLRGVRGGSGSVSYAHGGLSRSETGVWIRDEVCVKVGGYSPAILS